MKLNVVFAALEVWRGHANDRHQPNERARSSRAERNRCKAALRKNGNHINCETTVISFTTDNAGLFTRSEVWFYDCEAVKESGYTVFIAAKNKPRGRVYLLHAQQSNCIDLSKSAGELEQAVHKTIRYDVRMGEKHGFICEYHTNPSASKCDELLLGYNAFSRFTGLTPMSRNWLLAAVAQNGICFSQVRDSTQLIASHIYVHDKERALLAHSFHNLNFTDNKLRGYANKLLHWRDILYFKERGLEGYNWGGVNPALKGISDLKSRFGGEGMEHYSYIKANPLVYFAVSCRKSVSRNRTNSGDPVAS